MSNSELASEEEDLSASDHQEPLEEVCQETDELETLKQDIPNSLIDDNLEDPQVFRAQGEVNSFLEKEKNGGQEGNQEEEENSQEQDLDQEQDLTTSQNGEDDDDNDDGDDTAPDATSGSAIASGMTAPTTGQCF